MASTLSSVVGALRANLSLDSAQFQEGIAKAKSALKGFKGLMQNFGNAIKSGLLKVLMSFKQILIGVGVAATAAATAIAAGTIKIAKNAREIERQAKSLGMSVQGYQAMGKAAEKFGISQEQVGDIVKDANEKLGEYIATGGGELKDFMEQVAKPQGVSAEDLLSLPAEDRLIKMQSLMEAQNLTLEEQIFYWESIANDASKLRGILANSGAEFEAIKAKAIALGTILSDDVVANLSNFDKNLDSIGGTMSGWGNLLVSGFSGPLAELSGKLATVLQDAQWIRDIFTAMGTGIGVAISSISSAFDYVYTSLSSVNTEGSRFYDLGQSLAVIWEYLGGVFQRVWMLVSGGIQIAWGYLKIMIAAWNTMADVATYALSKILGPINSISDTMNNALGRAIQWVVGRFIDLSDDAVYNFELMAEGGKAAVDVIIKAFDVMPSALGDLMFQAANRVLGGIEYMVNSAIGMLNSAVQRATALAANIRAAMPFASEKTIKNAAMLNGPQLPAIDEVKLTIDNPFEGKFTEAVSELTNVVMNRINGVQNRNSGDNVGTTILPPPATIPPATGPYQPVRTTPGGGGGGKGGGGGGKESLSDEQREAERIAKQQNDAYKSLQERVETLGKTMGMTALEQKKFNDMMEQSKDTFVGAFADIVTGAKSAREVLSNVLSDMANRLAKMAANMAWDGFIDPMFGSVASSVTSWLPGFANGTSGAGAGFALVGEHGPELMQMRAGTKIRSNNHTNKLLNDMSNNGGQTAIRIDLGAGLEASILEKAKNQSVQISTEVSKANRKGMPNEMQRVSRDSRARYN